jgi:Na+-transporting methylmalonyl-CoA/oxaloacetate decarboxylase gamma subunit
MSTDKEPFWKDIPEPARTPFQRRFAFALSLFTISINISVIGIVFVLFFLFSHLLAWLWLAFMAVMYGYFFFKRIKQKSSDKNILQIQAEALRKAGASSIGSAIHVAGHPLLEREQPAVLALTGEGLKIFSYADDHPLDIISVKEITAVNTVTYDDERIPHLDVVNSAAQALQLTFERNGQEYKILFRRMRPLRPIDWYHELQKEKFNLQP